MHFRQSVALALTAAAFSACSYSVQRAHKLKEDQKVAALVQAATVDDRVRNRGEGAYEATYLAVFRSPDSAGPLVHEYCVSYPDYTSEVVRGGILGVNVADDDDVQSIVYNAAIAQAPTIQRYLRIIDTGFSCAPYQGNAIAAGIDEAQAHIVDLKTGRPLKKPFIVFKEKPDLPWPVRYHAPYYVYVNPEAKSVVGYAK
jgi:hypothetical protein